MKKIIKLFSILGLSLIFLVSCSSIKSTMKSVASVFKSPTKYNNVTATFVTTQGEITFFLYPEAAPLTVANFINLAKRGFYDNTKFTRSVDNFIVNGVHTVFGEVRSEGDFQKIRKLEMGDVVKEVKISENGDFILSLFKDQVEQWNAVLDREYPNLKKYPIKDPNPQDVEAYKEELERLYTKKQKDESNFEYPITKFIRKVFNKAGGYTPKAPVISN